MFGKIILGWLFSIAKVSAWYAKQHDLIAVILAPVWLAFIMLWLASVVVSIAVGFVAEFVYAIIQGIKGMGSELKNFAGIATTLEEFWAPLKEEFDLEEESEETDECLDESEEES